MPKLALDGIDAFHSRMVGALGTPKEPQDSLVFRVTALVHATLALIYSVSLQTCRALMHFAAFDTGRAKEGVRDLLSIAVQCVVLPLLGVAATFAPKATYQKTHVALGKYDLQRNEQGQMLLPSISPLQDRISRCVGGALLFPMVLLSIPAGSLSRLLTGRMLTIKQGANFPLALLLSLGSTVTLGTAVLCSDEVFHVVELAYNLSFPQTNALES